GPADSWSASSPANTAPAASPCWRKSRAWTPTPFAAANANCAAATGPGPAASADRAPAAHALKKKSPRSEAVGGTAARCYGRGSDLGPEVDAPVAAANPAGVAPARAQTGADHDRAVAAPTPLLV